MCHTNWCTFLFCGIIIKCEGKNSCHDLTPNPRIQVSYVLYYKLIPIIYFQNSILLLIFLFADYWQSTYSSREPTGYSAEYGKSGVGGCILKAPTKVTISTNQL